MDKAKKGSLLMLSGKILSKTLCPATPKDREAMSNIPYASAICSIMYAMLCTRPDVFNALSLMSRYQSDLGVEHWLAVKNILKYLNRTKEIFLVYGGEEQVVVKGYVDASLDTDSDDSKSQSGYIYILNGGAMSWRSYKQSVIANSTTKAEYMAALEASSEGVWIRNIITELGVVPSALDLLEILCDNTSVIALAKEPRYHPKTKHINHRLYIIRDYISDGDLKICKVHADLNVTYPLTKPLPRTKHDQHLNAMGVILLPNVN
jgi:hypothetical protein